MRLPSSAVVVRRCVIARGVAGLAALALVACGKSADAPAAGGAAPAMPPPQVGVVTVQPRSVALSTELPGRVEALRVAQVRARVNGVVLKRLFVEGSDVKAGQALFQIDPAPYQAALDSAGATLAKAQANRAMATELATRYKPLAEAKAISQQDYVNAEAARLQAEADVAAGQAAVQSAKLNLAYARVTAPIAGRIGRAAVTEGALVSAAEATLLATIQQVGTVYVNFTQSNTEVLRLRRLMAANKLRKVGNGEGAEVRVVLDDGSELPRPGKLLFTDLSVDPTSGQVTLRAEVPNAQGLAAARPVRARAHRAGRVAGRGAAAAAGGDAHRAGRQRAGGGAREQAADAPGAARRRARQRLDRAVGAASRRARDRRGLPEDDGARRARQSGAVVGRCAACAGRAPRAWHPAASAAAPARRRKGRPAWHASSSTVRSSRG